MLISMCLFKIQPHSDTSTRWGLQNVFVIVFVCIYMHSIFFISKVIYRDPKQLNSLHIKSPQDLAMQKTNQADCCYKGLNARELWKGSFGPITNWLDGEQSRWEKMDNSLNMISLFFLLSLLPDIIHAGVNTCLLRTNAFTYSGGFLNGKILHINLLQLHTNY